LEDQIKKDKKINAAKLAIAIAMSIREAGSISMFIHD